MLSTSRIGNVAGRRRQLCIVGLLLLLSLVACGSSPGTPDVADAEAGLRDDVVSTLEDAGLLTTFESRGADMMCDANGGANDFKWTLVTQLSVTNDPEVVAAALRGSMAVVERQAEGYYLVQQSSREPIGWTGELSSSGAGSSFLHLSTPVDLRDGMPDSTWKRSCPGLRPDPASSSRTHAGTSD